MPERVTLSVWQLNTYVKSLLQGDPHLCDLLVTGEISNFKRYPQSGHCYFTLKDSDAAISCVMFAGSAARLEFMPQDGLTVTVRAAATLYEPNGKYQLNVFGMYLGGVGEQAIKFELLKQKLSDEGLFSEEHKRPLPPYPKKIAVVTSDSGAAVRDITDILNDRYPPCEVLLCPVKVQGTNAAADITAMLKRVYKLRDIDIIIMGRGGGSAEDLSAFNDEVLARTVYASPVPVISAVGHETDFSICDLVADVRASTPSNAAEIAVPERTELLRRTEVYMRRIKTAQSRIFALCENRYKTALARAGGFNGENLLSPYFHKVDKLSAALGAIIAEKAAENQARLARAAARLDALSPLKTLSRGFAAVTKNGNMVKSAGELSSDDRINLRFKDGRAECTVVSAETEVIPLEH